MKMYGKQKGGANATHIIRLHRMFRATPEKLYRAFLDADAMVKWLPPHGFTGKVHQLDAKVGGMHKMSFTNFTTGASHSFGGKYLELVPHEPDTFDVSYLDNEVDLVGHDYVVFTFDDQNFDCFVIYRDHQRIPYERIEFSMLPTPSAAWMCSGFDFQNFHP